MPAISIHIAIHFSFSELVGPEYARTVTLIGHMFSEHPKPLVQICLDPDVFFWNHFYQLSTGSTFIEGLLCARHSAGSENQAVNQTY